MDDDVLKETYASRRPYGEWLDSNLVELKDHSHSEPPRGELQQ